MRLPRPTLSYPVTREFPASYALAAYIGSTIVLAFLVVINVALVGYETVSVFSSDFNITDHFWYDRLLPSFARSDGAPGSLCAARLIGLGDTVATNYSLFQYTVAAIDTPNAGDSGLAYTGWTLDDCDVTALYVNIVGQTLTSDFTAIVTCFATGDKNSSYTLRADWSQSALVGKYTSILGAKSASPTPGQAREYVLGAMVVTAGNDWAVWALNIFGLSNFTAPEVLSFAAEFPYCPASAIHVNSSCSSTNPPALNITRTTQITGSGSNGRVSTYTASRPIGGFNQPLLDLANDTFGFAHLASNTVQSLWAALRVDLGNPSPGNFLLDPSLVPRAVFRSFPIPQLPGAAFVLQNESFLYSTLVGDGYYAQSQGDSAFVNTPTLLPLPLPGPAVLDGVYLCQRRQLMKPGSVLVAVVAGTYTMFSTGWTVFLLLAETWFMRKKRDQGTADSEAAPIVAESLAEKLAPSRQSSRASPDPASAEHSIHVEDPPAKRASSLPADIPHNSRAMTDSKPVQSFLPPTHKSA
ncbi:hypothetical protein MIND_01166100 [Mycena indigotica]|uniref:Transmembrane protein n=1 Tax=Mycena indigotica TaxID=2126181 RepID=A0A8H6VSW2_9AGAR|nr:uncharacterized protein MIND_01166100 [Mycena indigotica]KAF7292679.1 hypothetical protein MIND_01166100 [Mycena indigotica]